MAVFLGTVRNVGHIGHSRRTLLDLYVYDDGILVGRSALTSMVLKLTVVGREAGDDLDRRRDGSIGATDRNDLLAAHEDNRFIDTSAISAIRYTHPWFPPIYRIDLELADGTRERFEWKRLNNEPKSVARILTQAFGDRLTTERI